MGEKEVITKMVPSLDCPLYDGQQPIHVDITVEGVKEGYVVISDYTCSKDPIPYIKVSISLDLARIATDIDQFVKEKKDSRICGIHGSSLCDQ
jgi:hypothetical protein